MRKHIIKLYAKIFSKPALSNINNFLLSSALRAMGYNNFRDDVESGEDFFISKILVPSNPKLCIDVGANVGNYTEKLLKHTQATVISFEPLPNAFERLQERAKKFGERSVLENMGVGERDEKLAIHYDPNALVHASFSEDVKNVPYVNNQNKMVVNVVSLDSYFKHNKILHVDFIKIDTEGFEYEVLIGAKEIFSNMKPKFIQIESNWHLLFRNMNLNYFANILSDYDVYQLIPSGWVKRDPKDPLSNIYYFSNFVFVRK